MDKKIFRKEYIEKRNSISYDEIICCSNIIMKKIFESEFYKIADNVFVYVNIKNEIITTDFINKSLESGKKVAVPVMKKEKGKMDFIEINDLNNLIPKKYGILEPEFNKNKIIKSNEKTLVIVPLLAFNAEKYRIGYGGGFYDRFMAENVALKFIGVAMEWQYTNNLPIDEYDMKLDMVFTEKNIY